MPLNKIDLNSDVGESFGNYTLGLDEEVIPLISSANIACGFHAGDPTVMRHTIAIAKKNGVAIGAHPGFPDLIAFGRRNIDASLYEIKDYVTYQIGALKAFTATQGIALQHVKPQHFVLSNTHGFYCQSLLWIQKIWRPYCVWESKRWYPHHHSIEHYLQYPEVPTS